MSLRRRGEAPLLVLPRWAFGVAAVGTVVTGLVGVLIFIAAAAALHRSSLVEYLGQTARALLFGAAGAGFVALRAAGRVYFPEDADDDGVQGAAQLAFEKDGPPKPLAVPERVWTPPARAPALEALRGFAAVAVAAALAYAVGGAALAGIYAASGAYAGLMFGFRDKKRP